MYGQPSAFRVTGGRWIGPVSKSSSSLVRLLCIPYAGAGASLFHSWQAELGSEIDVVPVLLPGRETRLQDRLVTSVDEMVAGIVGELHLVWDRPFAIFGHSMGGLIAYRTAQLLQNRSMPMPQQVFLSACEPHRARRDGPPDHELSDEDFVRVVGQMDGTPPELLANDELVSLVLPRLRADFAVVDSFRLANGSRIGIPITAMAGSEDERVTWDSVRQWSQHTAAGFTAHLLRGNHYFIADARDRLLRIIRDQLLPDARVSPGGK